MGIPACISSIRCNTAVESLSVYEEKVFTKIARNLPTQIKNNWYIFHIIDELNNSNLPTNLLLVKLDKVNMFLGIDNASGFNSVNDALELCVNEFPPISSVSEILELYLSCNNSLYDNTNYLQTDGATQGHSMFYSYVD